MEKKKTENWKTNKDRIYMYTCINLYITEMNERNNANNNRDKTKQINQHTNKAKKKRDARGWRACRGT